MTGVVTVDRSPEETYRFWQRLDTLPSFVARLDQVREDLGGRSHWRGSSATSGL
ncbi:MAG: hypothetical protein M0Z87_12275 [Actinomycetota bacterium]|nr:hypothetical protein [Actinomycetota bacterium]